MRGMAAALSMPLPGALIAKLLLFFYQLGRESEVSKLAATFSQFFGHLALLALPGAMKCKDR